MFDKVLSKIPEEARGIILAKLQNLRLAQARALTEADMLFAVSQFVD